MPLSPAVRVDIDRFWSTLDRSAGIGTGRENGLSRLALSDADRQMRDLFVTWCREAGLEVTVDRVGNIFARRAGLDDGLPPVLVGSHLDTQQNGGRFDGIAGVLGALEMIRCLNAAGHATRRPIEIVNWANEEGARFSPPMTAAGCFAGEYTVHWVHARTDDDGATFGDELARIGYLGNAEPGGRPLDAYFELHIEQGPILDADKVQVGIVTHAYSSHGFLVEFHGETAHTGPWPMELRKNALIAAARLLVAVDDIGWDFADTGGKGTGARLVAWPNKAGTLSDWAQAVCDVRHDDPQTSDLMAERVIRAAANAAAQAGCTAQVVDRWDWGGAIFDAGMVDGIRQQAARLGYSHRDLPSQAGHDAYFLARICPTAMIFTPCHGGITHNNHENATPADLEPGLNVLLHSVVAHADRSPEPA
ncbi:Zn-dependent hydrolase [Pararhodobacter sp. SW119]|uniref:Zn-dependent hydrolase n=1 Tax=Pararhodobacter sp. SW119 TaxID=2780075 RepID=UPI001AE07436|nr:Zn-dependent hydrolase [Pararhodobacter sp. SW119]